MWPVWLSFKHEINCQLAMLIYLIATCHCFPACINTLILYSLSKLDLFTNYNIFSKIKDFEVGEDLTDKIK